MTVPAPGTKQDQVLLERLHREVVMIRRGRSTFTVGTVQLSAAAGQTVFVPAGTPHTFRTLAPDRYESLAIHVSPAFISKLLEAGNDFS